MFPALFKSEERLPVSSHIDLTNKKIISHPIPFVAFLLWVHISPAGCPSYLSAILVRKAHPHPRFLSSLDGAGQMLKALPGKTQSPAQQHTGVNGGQGRVSPRRDRECYFIPVWRGFYYLHRYSLETIWRRFFWVRKLTHHHHNQHNYSAVRPPLHCCQNSRNEHHPLWFLREKSGLPFMSLFSLTQLGFLCNLISDKPIFWCC